MHKHSLLSKLLLLICICLTISSKSSAAVPLDSIAAIVNDQVITVSALKQRTLAVKSQLQQHKIKLPANNILQRQVLKMMIDESLTKQMVKRLNITASTVDVNQAVHSIAAQQKISIAQLYQSLSKNGISKNQFITELKQQIVNQKLMRAVIDGQVNVSSQEIEAGIKMLQSQTGEKNEFHLLHILIPMQDSPTSIQIATATKKAQQIIKELKQGKDFKTLAAAKSSGSQMFNGGDMGWKTLAALPTVFADRVLTMKKGDVAGPIRTTNGMHIIKLIDLRGKKQNLNIDAAELRTRVGNMILQRKLAEKQQAWLQQLRANAYVKVLTQ